MNASTQPPVPAQIDRPLSGVIGHIMRTHQLLQRDVAVLLGVSLARVKSITSGRVKNLTSQEASALILKLGVSGDWLATGLGAMHGPIASAAQPEAAADTTLLLKRANWSEDDVQRHRHQGLAFQVLHTLHGLSVAEALEVLDMARVLMNYHTVHDCTTSVFQKRLQEHVHAGL